MGKDRVADKLLPKNIFIFLKALLLKGLRQFYFLF
jgi:hypothetical protein